MLNVALHPLFNSMQSLHVLYVSHGSKEGVLYREQNKKIFSFLEFPSQWGYLVIPSEVETGKSGVSTAQWSGRACAQHTQSPCLSPGSGKESEE